MEAIEFLESKNLIKEGFSKFIITLSDGTVINLPDLMTEYANQSKWISVEDGLPPEKVMKISEDVIVYDGKDVFVDCYDYEFNQWCRSKYKSTITYWQPLPTEPCQTT